MQTNQENQGFDLQKNNEKAMPKHIRKKHRKKASQKSIFTSLRASQNLSKSTKTKKKNEKKWVSNEACFATLWESHASRRKLTEVMA